MAEMTIRLQIDPTTGKRDIIVSLSSDADSLPFEHEQQHRELVDKLIEGGALKAGDIGKVIISRRRETAIPATPESNPQKEERKSLGEEG